MPITGSKHAFTADNIKTAPDESGVYALYKTGKLVYVGSATDSIRNRLLRHYNGEEGEATKSATDYACETTGSPEARERELLQEYKDAKGTLPDCNDVMPNEVQSQPRSLSSSVEAISRLQHHLQWEQWSYIFVLFIVTVPIIVYLSIKEPSNTTMLGVRVLTQDEVKEIIEETVPRILAEAIDERLSQVISEVRAAEARIAAMGDVVPEGVLAQELAGIKSNLADTVQRLSDLELAIIETPVKALSIPLMKQEVAALRLEVERDRLATRDEIARIYDQNNMWFFGLIIPIAVGVIIIAVTNYFKSSKPEVAG